MIFTLKCRNYRRYKGVRKTRCCWACWWRYTFNRGHMTRTPKPSPQAELPLTVGEFANYNPDSGGIEITRSQHQETLP